MKKNKLNQLEDRIVVDEFVRFLASHGHEGLKIGRRPDEENRGTPDIDAIAGNFAIEHTSIDTIPNQRRNDAWFMTAVGDLEKELRSHPKTLRRTMREQAI